MNRLLHRFSSSPSILSKWRHTYDTYFLKGICPEELASIQAGGSVQVATHFWDALYLLDVDGLYLKNSVHDMARKELLKLKYIWIMLIHQSIDMLLNPNDIRIHHSLQTLFFLFQGFLEREWNLTMIDDLTFILSDTGDLDSIFIPFFTNMDACLQQHASNDRIVNDVFALLELFIHAIEPFHNNHFISFLTRTPGHLVSGLLAVLRVERPPENAIPLCSAYSIWMVLSQYEKTNLNPYLLSLYNETDGDSLKTICKVPLMVFSELSNSFEQEMARSGQRKGYIRSAATYLKSYIVATPSFNVKNLIRSVPNLFSATLALYELFKGNAKAACILCETGSELLLIEFIKGVMGALFLSLKEKLATAHIDLLLLIKLNFILLELLVDCPVTFELLVQDTAEGCLGIQILEISSVLIQSQMNAHLQVELLRHNICVLRKWIAHLSLAKKRIDYDWNLTWLSLMRGLSFLSRAHAKVTHQADLPSLVYEYIALVEEIITLAEHFLPGSDSFDFFYYHLMCHRESILSLASAFQSSLDSQSESMHFCQILHAVYEHFEPLLRQAQEQARNRLTPKETIKVIKSHFATLQLPSTSDSLTISATISRLKYHEQSKDAPFFNQILRRCIEREIKN